MALRRLLRADDTLDGNLALIDAHETRPLGDSLRCPGGVTSKTVL